MMKRLIAVILVVMQVALPGVGWGASVTRYINDGCTITCDGTTTENGYRNIYSALLDADVGDGDGDILNFVAGSGPYGVPLVIGPGDDSVSFVGNDVTVRGDRDVHSYVDGTAYEWIPSTDATYAGWYYLVKNCDEVEKVVNGLFTYGVTGWTSSNTDTFASVYDADRDDFVLNLIETTTTGYVYQSIALEAKTYNWSADIRGDDGTIKIDVYKVGGGELRTLVNNESIPSAAGWVTRSGSFTITAAASYYIRVMLGVNRAYNVRFDSISVAEPLGSPAVCAPTDIIPLTPYSVEIKDGSADPINWSWFAASHTPFHPDGANNPIDDMEADGYADINGFIGNTDRANWAFGDQDSLGFNALYIYLPGGISPTGTSGLQVFVPYTDVLVTAQAGSTGHSFNNIKLIGANDYIYQANESVSFDNVWFENCDSHAIDSVKGDASIKYSSFVNTGHRDINIKNDSLADARVIDFYNNYTFGTHLWYLNLDTSGVALTVQNNSSLAMCYGIADFNLITAITLIQDYNQYSLDPVCHDGGNLQLDATGIWEVTGAHDIPANLNTLTATCNAPGQTGCGVSGVNSVGSPTSASQNINAGTVITGIHDQATPATDINGTSVLTIPDIGAYEHPGGLYFNAAAADGGNGTRALPYNAWTDYVFTGYNLRAGAEIYLQGAMTGTLDLSGLTDTGAIFVKPWPGKKLQTINGFIPNGTETTLQAGPTFLPMANIPP